MKSVGILSLAINPPSKKITNDDLRREYPEIVANAEKHSLAKLWKPVDEKVAHPLEVEMAPYLKDPFRGSMVRYVLGSDETSLSLECKVARQAIAASKLTPEEIDLVIVCSTMPDTFMVGNGAYLVKELGLNCPAINMESACNGSVMALHTACDLVRVGSYKNALVVCSATNSRAVSPDDSMGWFLGDCSAAFVVGPVKRGYGIQGKKIIHTAATLNMFRTGVMVDPFTDKGWRFCTFTHKNAAGLARDTAIEYLETCVHGALNEAGKKIEDVDFFVFNSPTAWYPDFCGRALGASEGKWLSIYPKYANVGNCLMPTGLYHALLEGKVKPGDTVVFYAVGSTSTASAVVMKVGSIGVSGPTS